MKNKPLNQLRVLHSAALLQPPSGIITQMVWEKEAAEVLDIEWQVKMYCPVNSEISEKIAVYDYELNANKLTNPIFKLFAWVKLRYNYHRWLLLQQDSVDAYILRYYVHDPFQLWFVKLCKKPIYFVHHTLEIPELKLPSGFSGWIRPNLESFLGKATISKVNGIIGVTEEIVNYERERAKVLNGKYYVYPNGIIYKELNLIDQRREDIPELLFVANFAPWHGLDTLLKAIDHSKENFILHLVGNIPLDLLPLKDDKRIVVHGKLSHNDIVELSQKCWIGLSSFALERKKMREACPLKVREYLMLGLPVYGDYKDVFPLDAPYFMSGSEAIFSIINFAFKTRRLDKKDVAQLAKDYIDKKVLLNDLYTWLCKITKEV